MDLFSLILYGGLNAIMVLYYFVRKNQYFHFPFWAGALSLGWFFPQAITAFKSIGRYPEGSFSSALLFASLCTLALWIAYHRSVNKSQELVSWLDIDFDLSRLVIGGSLLCFGGFFFEWKLSNLPVELLRQSQWSGITVRYYFLSSIFHFGFIALWLIYLKQRKVIVPHLLLFIIPGLMSLLNTAVVSGRRAGMMTLVAYLILSFWFIRRVAFPRWALLVGLVAGFALVNTIGTYRSIMGQSDLPLPDKIKTSLAASFQAAAQEETGGCREFDNFLYYRKVTAEEMDFDYGLTHWNRLVFNYVPAQVVGRAFKDSLMIKGLSNHFPLALERYGHKYHTGTVVTGYFDSFKSFGWFGFVKFLLAGWMMGVLYRHAMEGSFLGQLLYVYLLCTAMHAISHGTNQILCSKWIYFFALGFPVFYWARIPPQIWQGEHDPVQD